MRERLAASMLALALLLGAGSVLPMPAAAQATDAGQPADDDGQARVETEAAEPDAGPDPAEDRATEDLPSRELPSRELPASGEPATGGRLSARPAPSRFGAPAPDSAYGAFQRGLFLTARNLALPRAEAGDAAAQTLLGEIYSRGLGVAVDPDEAQKWYAQAARQGVPEAQLQVALTMLAEDPESAEARTLMEAAADAGHGKAMFNHAQILLSDRPGPSGQRAAYGYFRRAAEAGIADAQYALAQYYLQGTPPVFYDEEAARQWMQRAARQGFGSAQFELATMYLDGVGGARDLDQGFLWTARAAHGGNVAAQAQLAKLIWNGIGIEPDDAQAAAWYVVARRAGLRDPVLEDFWLGLSARTQQEAISRANDLQRR